MFDYIPEDKKNESPKSRHRALGDLKRTKREGKTTSVAYPNELSMNPLTFKERRYVKSRIFDYILEFGYSGFNPKAFVTLERKTTKPIVTIAKIRHGFSWVN